MSRKPDNTPGDLPAIVTALALTDPTPEEGLQAVTEFFLAGEDIFRACDDSNGSLGDVFNLSYSTAR